MTTTTHTYLEHGLSILHAKLQPSRTDSRSPLTASARPFLTLSRESCAGATALGEYLVPLLDEHLGTDGRSWMFLDKDLLTKALTQHHLPEHLAHFLPEDRLPEIQGLIGEIVGLHPPLWDLEHRVAEAILQIAKLGGVIFADRAAHLITRCLPAGLHVRLIAPLAARVQRMQTTRNCDAVTATGLLREADRARRRYVQANYGTELDDPHAYDLTINTDQITTATAAELVLCALQARQHSLVPAG